MAKWHMKRPRIGIRSTSKKAKTTGEAVQSVPVPIPQVASPLLPQYNEEPRPYPGPAYDARMDCVNIIPEDELIVNVFCFAAFTNKISGVVYNDLTRNFPFTSIDGSVCFFVLYHWSDPRINFVSGLHKHLFVFGRVIQFVCDPRINGVCSHKLSV